MSIILDRILEDSNIEMAMEQVIANKGASGIDNLTIDELRNHLKKNWSNIKKQIQERTYKPQPVRRVEIPKPTGGVRKLGIPTV
jgi:retron-type reverse transcriptase